MAGRSAFPLDILEFNLDDRISFIKDHDEEMDYICSRLSQYYEDVEHALDYGLSHSVVSHYTYNLVLVLAKGLTSLTIYEYVRGAYLLKDDYDSVYKTWKSVHDSSDDIIPLLTKLEEENYFEEDIDMEDFIGDILPPHCERAKGCERLLDLHRRVSLKTGSSLVNTLCCYLRHMEQWLADFKTGLYKGIEEDYERVYSANYNLYKKEYWPKDGQNFRQCIEHDNFLSVEITPDYLARCLMEEKRNFEQTPTGQLRRDFIDDKKNLYFEVKRIGLNEEQWRYFFKTICRFEEYARWIEELRTPRKTNRGLHAYVVKPEIAEEVVGKISELIQNETKPKSIVRPIRAAMDAGVMHRPTWEAFVEEYGKQRIRSSTSFNSYTNPEQDPYSGPSYNTLVDEFSRFLPE